MVSTCLQYVCNTGLRAPPRAAAHPFSDGEATAGGESTHKGADAPIFPHTQSPEGHVPRASPVLVGPLVQKRAVEDP